MLLSYLTSNPLLSKLTVLSSIFSPFIETLIYVRSFIFSKTAPPFTPFNSTFSNTIFSILECSNPFKYNELAASILPPSTVFISYKSTFLRIGV